MSMGSKKGALARVNVRLIRRLQRKLGDRWYDDYDDALHLLSSMLWSID